MLGKCRWKMYSFGDEFDPRAESQRPSLEVVLSSFEMAIETVPRPRDSRAEPILEPHYKLVSIAHKLVMSGVLPHQDAANLLQRKPFAINKGEHVTVPTTVAWE